ncbi:MAG: DUF1761 domain-containing protein [Candidatus Latescibacterota bacterium]|nr:MAG: DUF1761 domain-containing protein [Candidatus Latescibacterota bacterium]
MATDVNFWAILVAGIAYFVLGGVWYAVVWRKPWTRALALEPDVKEQAEKDFPKALVCHLLSGILTAVVLGFIIRTAGANTFLDGVIYGLWVWLAFGFTINLNSFMFEKRPAPVFLTNGGFYLAAFAVVGGILAGWQ